MKSLEKRVIHIIHSLIFENMWRKSNLSTFSPALAKGLCSAICRVCGKMPACCGWYSVNQTEIVNKPILEFWAKVRKKFFKEKRVFGNDIEYVCHRKKVVFLVPLGDVPIGFRKDGNCEGSC